MRLIARWTVATCCVLAGTCSVAGCLAAPEPTELEPDDLATSEAISEAQEASVAGDACRGGCAGAYQGTARVALSVSAGVALVIALGAFVADVRNDGRKP